MTTLSEARRTLDAAQTDVRDAESKYAELGAQLAAARQQGEDARQSGDVGELARATADAGALATLVRDAGDVVRERQRVAEDARRAVADIETAAEGLRRQIDALGATLADPRNEYAKRVWAAEATLSQAEHGLARAKREQASAAAHLDELRSRLASLAG